MSNGKATIDLRLEEEKLKNSEQTNYSFNSKWNAVSSYQIDGVSSFDSDTLSWIINRNGFSTLEEFATYLDQFDFLLDAGCGNGRILGLLNDILDDEKKLMGIDFASADIARSNLADRNIEVLEADLMDLSTLENLGRPDFIYCQEVLHHTAKPSESFANLCAVLAPGGELAVYVYKEKAPIREFTDDFVRDKIAALSFEDAIELTNDFTELGKVLSELNVSVEVPAVRLLGITSGIYSVQRLLYHFFVKCYWNPELSLEINNAVNFDWYHPSICSRHTRTEVESWFMSNGLEVVQTNVDEYGITMRGRKPQGMEI